MDLIPRANVVHKLEKRSLLIAINCIAALSIFFFGYDQGMMGGVNGAENYYEKHMHFGHPGPDGSPVIDDTLLQGGIVSESDLRIMQAFVVLRVDPGFHLLRRHPGGLLGWWLVW